MFHLFNNSTIMKAKYLKPAIDISTCSSEDIMISASNGEGTVWQNGGNTSGSGVTSGDARWHNTLWDEDDE